MTWGVSTVEGFLFGIELQQGYWLKSPHLRHCHRNSHSLAWEQWWVVDNSSLSLTHLCDSLHDDAHLGHMRRPKLYAQRHDVDAENSTLHLSVFW